MDSIYNKKAITVTPNEGLTHHSTPKIYFV